MPQSISFKDYQILKELYARGCSYLTVGYIAHMLGITAEGARYRCNILVEMGWMNKTKSYRTYYTPIKSTELRTTIITAIAEFEERELK